MRLKDAEGERRAVEERDEVSRIEEEEEGEEEITTEASNSESKRGRRLKEVEAELKREREMRLKLQEALQDMMKLQASSDRSPRDPLSSRGSRDSARNTARSAASGYDDHPTHRFSSSPPLFPQTLCLQVCGSCSSSSSFSPRHLRRGGEERWWGL